MTPMPPTDLALRIAALKVLGDYISQCYADARAEATRTLKRGERIVARSPVDDQKIAVIPMSDPKPVATVTDEAALLEWMAEHYPEKVKSGYKIIGSLAEVVDALFEHAPHLLKRGKTITPEALHELRTSSAALGQPVGPGGEADIPGIQVKTPDGVVTCRPVDEAFDIIRDLHQQGVLELDGTVATAIPRGNL